MGLIKGCKSQERERGCLMLPLCFLWHKGNINSQKAFHDESLASGLCCCTHGNPPNLNQE